jgi:hypothetical protein
MALLFPTTPTPGQTYAAPNGITYTWDNTLQVWTGGAGGGGSTVTAASLAEAAAGTLNTVYSSPQTAVPKDAAGMTGAAIIPSGTDAQRAAIAAPVVGMQRFNTTTGYFEGYTGATLGWKKLSFVVPTAQPTDLTYSANTTLSGVYVCRNLTINAGVTITVGSQALVFICSDNATINGNIDGDGAGPSGGLGIGISSAGGNSPISQSNPGIGFGFNRATYSPYVSIVGTGGASGTAVIELVGSIQPSYGGNGGSAFGVKAAGNITQAATSIISVRGGNAFLPSNGSNNFGAAGGGGGSGGSIILEAGGNLSVAGTLNVSGGNGQNGFINGTNAGAAGGGGGGGGTIILQTLGSLTDTSTKPLSGGAGGAGAGNGGIGAPSGGSSGGAGGLGGNIISAPFSINGQSGSAGVVLYYGSPL